MATSTTYHTREYRGSTTGKPFVIGAYASTPKAILEHATLAAKTMRDDEKIEIVRKTVHSPVGVEYRVVTTYRVYGERLQEAFTPVDKR